MKCFSHAITKKRAKTFLFPSFVSPFVTLVRQQIVHKHSRVKAKCTHRNALVILMRWRLITAACEEGESDQQRKALQNHIDS